MPFYKFIVKLFHEADQIIFVFLILDLILVSYFSYLVFCSLRDGPDTNPISGLFPNFGHFISPTDTRFTINSHALFSFNLPNLQLLSRHYQKSLIAVFLKVLSPKKQDRRKERPWAAIRLIE